MRTLSSAFLLLLSTTSTQVTGFATPRPMFSSVGTLQTTASTLFAAQQEKDSIPTATEADNDDSPTIQKSLNPTPVLWKYAKPIALSLAVLASTTVFDGASAAMSGGRMGGSFSAPMRSAPMPRMNSGGGGAYSRGGYSGGYYGGGGAATIIAPSYYARPAMPLFYGSPGVVTVSRGGISPFDLLFLGGFGFLAVSSLMRGVGDSASGLLDDTREAVTGGSSALGNGVSVARVSVAVEVPNRDDRGSLLSVLAQTARSADTETRRGVQQLTSQIALEVLRRKSSIVGGSTSYEHFRDVRKAERTFNQWSVDERSKFEKENTSRFGSMDRSMRGDRASLNDSRATMAVVTFVISIQGDSTKVPSIRSAADIETALSRIAADSKVDDCLLSAEILWTPEDRDEVLTRRDVLVDYPGLIDV